MSLDESEMTWDTLPRHEQIKAEQLLIELDDMFSKYSAQSEDSTCEDLTLGD